MPGPRYSDDGVFNAQFEKVEEAGRLVGVTLDRAPTEQGGAVPPFLFQKDHLVVGHEVDIEHPLLHELGAMRAPATSEALLGKFRPPTNYPGRAQLLSIKQQPQGRSVLDVIVWLREKGFEGDVAPNHFVSICPVNLCPATEPEPLTTTPTKPKPDWPAGRNDGLGVKVHVIDTGIIEGEPTRYPHIFRAEGSVGWDALNHPYDPAVSHGNIGNVRPYGGHGMFVAGVLKWFAPAITLYEWKLLQMAGGIMEDALADGLMNALGQNPDIISLSAGGTTYKDLPHLALRPFYDGLRQSTKTLLVAAAGNDGETEPFYPAATHLQTNMRDKVVSVGALRDGGGGRACFSNYGDSTHGDWVRVFAPGEKHVNAFPPGYYKYLEPRATECRYYKPPLYPPPCTCINGPQAGSAATLGKWASWSGTSFATPLVAGRIAAYMTQQGESNARTAADKFLRDNTVRILDSGGGMISALTM